MAPTDHKLSAEPPAKTAVEKQPLEGSGAAASQPSRQLESSAREPAGAPRQPWWGTRHPFHGVYHPGLGRGTSFTPGISGAPLPMTPTLPSTLPLSAYGTPGGWRAGPPPPRQHPMTPAEYFRSYLARQQAMASPSPGVQGAVAQRARETVETPTKTVARGTGHATPPATDAVEYRRLSALLALPYPDLAPEERGPRETAATEALIALSKSIDPVTAEVVEAFAEADELFAELNKTPTPAARPKDDAGEKLVEEEGTDGAGADSSSSDKANKGDGKKPAAPEKFVPAWPPEWSLVTPIKYLDPKSSRGRSEVAEDQELTPAYKAAVESVEVLLGSGAQAISQRTQETGGPAGGLTSDSSGDSEGGSERTVRPYAGVVQGNAQQPVVLGSNSSVGTAEGAGKQQKAPVPRRATDMLVALPDLSLLALRPRSSTTVTGPLLQPAKVANKTTTNEAQDPARMSVVEQAKTSDSDKASTSLKGFDGTSARLSLKDIGDHVPDDAAKDTSTRIFDPPPGLTGLTGSQPAAAHCIPFSAPVTIPSTSYRPRPSYVFQAPFTTSRPQDLMTRGLNLQPRQANRQQNLWSQGTEQSTKSPQSSLSNMDPYDRARSSYLTQQDLDNHWPDFRNKALRFVPVSDYPLLPVHSAAASSSHAAANSLTNATQATEAPSIVSRSTNAPNAPPPATNAQKQSSAPVETVIRDEDGKVVSPQEVARIQRSKADWARCIGRSDDVAVERLPWQRMERYYPNGLPRRIGRYIPIPDDWQQNNPLRARPTMAGMSRAPSEQARYSANLDRTFYSGARYWHMSVYEAAEDVRLRHIFACYIHNLGLSRAEFNREYDRFAEVFDDTYAPGPYGHLTVGELRSVDPAEITEPLMTMAFRNLLLHRAEEFLPEGHKTFRSVSGRTITAAEQPSGSDNTASATTSTAREPHPHGAIGEEWKREKQRKAKEAKAREAKGKGKAKQNGKGKGKETWTGDQPGDDTEDDEQGGESSAAGAKKGGRRRKHLLGYAC